MHNTDSREINHTRYNGSKLYNESIRKLRSWFKIANFRKREICAVELFLFFKVLHEHDFIALLDAVKKHYFYTFKILYIEIFSIYTDIIHPILENYEQFISTLYLSTANLHRCSLISLTNKLTCNPLMVKRSNVYSRIVTYSWMLFLNRGRKQMIYRGGLIATTKYARV